MALSTLALVIVFVAQIACGANHLSQAVVALIEQTFVQRANVLNVYIKCKEESERVSYFTDLTNSVVRELDKMPVRVGWQRELPIDVERHFSVFLIDSLESLRELCRELWTRHYTIDGNMLIILRTFSGSYYEELVEICKENLNIGIVNANVVVEPLPGLVLMFTFYPFSTHACFSAEPVLINQFRNSEWQNDVLFPLKLKDLHGCTLICATWEDQPYLKILGDSSSDEMYDGIEGRLLDFMSARMNFKVQFYLMNEEEIDATLDEKGVIFDELFKTGVEFVVGAFHYKPIREEDLFSPSDSYYLSRICVVLSSRRDEFSPYTKLVFPFTLCLWIIVAAYFSAGILVSLAANHLPSGVRTFILGARNDAPVYNMFYIAIGGGVNRVPRRNFARFLLLVWLVMWLVLRSAYQSALFYFIRTRLTQPLPESIDEVIRAKYEVLLTPPTFNILKYMPRLRAASLFLNGTEVENFPMLSREQKKIAIITPYEYFGYFRKLNRDQNDDFYMPRENVFNQQLSIYMKKSSFLLHAFNSRIVEYVAVGLHDKSERSVIDLERVEVKKSSSTSRNVNLHDVMGAVEIFLLGCAISSVVFVVEVLSQYFYWEVVLKWIRLRR